VNRGVRMIAPAFRFLELFNDALRAVFLTAGSLKFSSDLEARLLHYESRGLFIGYS
jgi:hypothetical protein